MRSFVSKYIIRVVPTLFNDHLMTITQHILPCVIEGPKVDVALADGDDDPGLQRMELGSHDSLGGALKLTQLNLYILFIFLVIRQLIICFSTT
jgi:hypothetical protein